MILLWFGWMKVSCVSSRCGMPYIGRGMIAAVSILSIVLVILSALMHYALARARYQREERLREWAAELGLNVSVQRDGVPDQPYGRFAIFNSGMEQHQLLTISGQLDITFGDQTRTCDVLLGDIEQIDEAADAGMPWWLGLLAGPSKHRFSYLLMRLPFANVTAMRIRHRFGPGGIGAIAGWDTIETEWMDFNRSMQIVTRDRRFASALISKRMMGPRAIGMGSVHRNTSSKCKFMSATGR